MQHIRAICQQVKMSEHIYKNVNIPWDCWPSSVVPKSTPNFIQVARKPPVRSSYPLPSRACDHQRPGRWHCVSQGDTIESPQGTFIEWPCAARIITCPSSVFLGDQGNTSCDKERAYSSDWGKRTIMDNHGDRSLSLTYITCCIILYWIFGPKPVTRHISSGMFGQARYQQDPTLSSQLPQSFWFDHFKRSRVGVGYASCGGYPASVQTFSNGELDHSLLLFRWKCMSNHAVRHSQLLDATSAYLAHVTGPCRAR